MDDSPIERRVRIVAAWLVLGCAIPMLVSCSSLGARTKPLESLKTKPGGKPVFRVNQALYDKATPGETEIHVSLTDQTAKLFDRAGRVLIETQVSSGVPGHSTPTGRFNVLARKVDKRSNLYGRYVDRETGKIVVREAWKHSGPKPAGSVYRGIAMPYWMRLTWTGIGVHVGSFPAGYRSSHGCIRVPEAVQPLIFAKTRVGTPVEIVP